MKFSEIPYKRPDPDAVFAECKALTERLQNANHYEEARASFLAWEEQFRLVNTMDLVAMIRHQMDPEDAFYQEEDAFWWDFEPKHAEFEKLWAEALLDSPFRKELAAEYGEMMFRIAAFDRRITSEQIVADRQRENKLIVAYSEQFDDYEVPFEGGTVSSDELDEIKEDADGERRLAAYKADGAYWRGKAEKLDALYDELVRLRDGMGKKLGFDGYTDFAYCRLHRSFTKEDVARFREAVVKYVVPIADTFKREQAKRIGRPYPLAYSDNEYFFRNGNPHPAGDADFLIDEGRKFFETLSPEAGEFFRHMIENEMIFPRAGGGNDIYLPYYETPFLMVGLDGSGDSVRSFMHEAGHTFAYWMNRKRIPVYYVRPSEDITELHSMCMELLSLQHAEAFFGPDAKKYTYSLLAESVAFLTYGTMIDHFEHTVFAHPEMTPEERHAEWNRLEAIYEPWIAFDREMPYYGEGMLWQQQGHIYESPFMYIDYVLAGVVGLAVWAIAQKDPKEAWERYMALVKQGGTRPFVALLEHAGLPSPFDPKCLQTVCETVKDWLTGFDLTGIV